MSPAPEDGLQVTLYQAPSDPHAVIMTKDAIIARLMADLAQANADKEDLQARLTKQKQSETILENINDEQDARIAELEVKLRRHMKKYRDLKRERDVFDRALDRQDYEIVELKKEVSGQNKKLNDQEREIERLETQLGIWERVVDEDNASTNSDSSSTDYNLMDIASDQEEEEDIDEECGYFPARYYNDSDNSSTSTSTSTSSNSSTSTGTISIESEDEAMDDN